MILKSIYLQHFRNYTEQKFEFSPSVTIVIGPNTAGKTNLCEAIHLLSSGKSFKTGDSREIIQFGEEVGRVGGVVTETSNIKYPISNTSNDIFNKQKTQSSASDSDQPRMTDQTKLEIVLVGQENGRQQKRFFVNGVAKSRFAYIGLLPLVLFRPEELDIIIDGPSLRRDFLDSILEQVDKDYFHASIAYAKALRQRNALLDLARETGTRDSRQFAYWDDLLIENGAILTNKRDQLIAFFNTSKKEIFDVQVMYDKSVISKERLLQYVTAELGAGNTLVGPHRDDMVFYMNKDKDVRSFGSRGQQRLVVLQLKLLQIAFMEKAFEEKPLLVLDDIFSELDENHIQLVLQMIGDSQAIITTTHKEFIPKAKLKEYSIIEMEKSP